VRPSIAAQVVQFALRRHGLAAAEPRTRKGALGLLIFRKRGRARSWHGSLYRQRLGSGVPVRVIWASTEGITSVAREIVIIARKSCTAISRPASSLSVVQRRPVPRYGSGLRSTIQIRDHDSYRPRCERLHMDNDGRANKE